MRAPPGSSLLVLYGPQGNSLGLLYALANKFTVFSQVYSTTGKQVSPPSSPSAALANFLYQPTLCLVQNFSPITYPSKGIRLLLCECELVTIFSAHSRPQCLLAFQKTLGRGCFFPEKPGTRKGALHHRIRGTKSLKHSPPGRYSGNSWWGCAAPFSKS